MLIVCSNETVWISPTNICRNWVSCSRDPTPEVINSSMNPFMNFSLRDILLGNQMGMRRYIKWEMIMMIIGMNGGDSSQSYFSMAKDLQSLRSGTSWKLYWVDSSKMMIFLVKDFLWGWRFYIE